MDMDLASLRIYIEEVSKTQMTSEQIITCYTNIEKDLNVMECYVELMYEHKRAACISFMRLREIELLANNYKKWVIACVDPRGVGCESIDPDLKKINPRSFELNIEEKGDTPDPVFASHDDNFPDFLIT